MPVQFDEFEAQADEVDWPVREGSNAHHILAFLLERPDTGFTPSEIAERTGVPRGSVGPTLHRLETRGLVRHKEPYWAVATDDRLAEVAGMLASMQVITETGQDGWADVDPSEYEVTDEALAAWRREE